MKIFLFVLIGSILSSTIPGYNNYFVNDITFLEEYKVNMADFYPYNFIPAGANYYFRMEVIEDDEMEIQLTVEKNALINFDVKVCGFTSYPDGAKVVTLTDHCGGSLTGELKEKLDLTSQYVYPFETPVDCRYLAVHITLQNSLYYLSVYVYSAKAMATVVLVCIIVAPIILVGAIIGIILKKMGCIGKRY